MGDRYIKSDDNKKILFVDADNLYNCAMSQSLPYDKTEFVRNVNLEDISNTPGESDNGYFSKVDFS